MQAGPNSLWDFQWVQITRTRYPKGRLPYSHTEWNTVGDKRCLKGHPAVSSHFAMSLKQNLAPCQTVVSQDWHLSTTFSTPEHEPIDAVSPETAHEALRCWGTPRPQASSSDASRCHVVDVLVRLLLDATSIVFASVKSLSLVSRLHSPMRLHKMNPVHALCESALLCESADLLPRLLLLLHFVH